MTTMQPKPVPSRPVGFGLIGTGMAGGFNARELAFVEGGFLAAVCSRDSARVRAFAADHGNPRAYTDYRDLIADPEVEVVVVTSPTGLHAAMAEVAADAGRHVLVEKPLEATVPAAERMVEHCRRRGVRLGVIFQMRFGRVADRLRELLGSGGLGEIWLADAFDKASRSPAYYRKAAWRGTAEFEGGGCLMTQSIHIIDLLQHLVGPVASVFGRIATRRHAIEVEDVATAMLRFENGAMGVVESTTAIRPALRSRLEIHGERGTVIANAQYDEFLVWDVEGVPGPEGAPAKLPETSDWLDTDDPWAYPQTRHRIQLQDMADAVRENRDPVLTGEEALASLRVVKAIQESSARGREISLRP